MKIENPNTTAFSAILGSTYSIELPATGILIECRRVPFTTVTHVLSDVLSGAQLEIMRAKQSLVDLLQHDAAQDQSDTRVFFSKLVNVFLPLVANLSIQTPELAERILLDVIVDATPPIVRALSAEDALAVITEAFNKMDKAVLAKQVETLFFAIRGTMETFAILRTQMKESATQNGDTSTQQGAIE